MDEILNVTLSKEAEEVYAEWFNSNVEITNKEPKGYLKGVYGKLDVISLRLAVVVHGMKMACNENVSNLITSETMISAIELIEYFRETALKVYTKIFEDKSSAELYSKNFKKYYKGKPTKRYLKLMQKIEQANFRGNNYRIT